MAQCTPLKYSFILSHYIDPVSIQVPDPLIIIILVLLLCHQVGVGRRMGEGRNN